MLIDYHIHSTFSSDSISSLDEICTMAIRNNIGEIAITDHVDYTYPTQQPNHFIKDMDLYFHSIASMREKYKNQLCIKTGVEIGLDSHRLDDYDTLLKQYSFDFVIGSIHSIDQKEVHTSSFYENRTKEQAYQRYYEQILYFLDSYHNFDVIGHLDYCKRYIPQPYQTNDHLLAMDYIEAVLKKIVDKGKGLEVNTSGFRHVSNASMPHIDILTRYLQLGGKRITIGSDSHRPEHVGYHAKEAQLQLKQIGFTTLSTFSQRQEKYIFL